MSVKEAGTYHVPVLLKESIDALEVFPGGTYVDVTFGGGGHSKEILSRLKGKGHLYSFDQDADAESNIGLGTLDKECFTFVRSNFRYLKNWMRYYGVEKIDGILADLGVSSHHFDDEERGFSFRFDAPLDMRMNQAQKFSAADVINNFDESRLIKIFSEYGEERFSKRIAAAICKARKISPLETTGELVKLIEQTVPRTKNGGHPAKRIFQAVRIEVNNELEILSGAITAAVKRLKIGGRIAVITFHSLEDRIVKQTFKTLAQDCICPKNFPVCTCGHKAEIKILGKAKTATADELNQNSRAKSAKLRIAEKI